MEASGTAIFVEQIEKGLFDHLPGMSYFIPDFDTMVALIPDELKCVSNRCLLFECTGIQDHFTKANRIKHTLELLTVSDANRRNALGQCRYARVHPGPDEEIAHTDNTLDLGLVILSAHHMRPSHKPGSKGLEYVLRSFVIALHVPGRGEGMGDEQELRISLAQNLL